MLQALYLILFIISAFVSVILIKNNIKLKKQIEEHYNEQRKAEEQFRTIAENAPFPIVISDLRSNIIYFNKPAEVKFELESNGFSGLKADRFLICREDKKRVMKSLLRKGQLSNKEIQLLTDKGKRFWALYSANIIDFSGKKAVIVAFHDISDRKLAEDELKRQASTDSLTGIYNRKSFMELIEQEWRRAARYDSLLSALYIDLDHFKKINDEFGHQKGDKALMLFTNTCIDLLRESDIFGRVGGEEFAIVLPETGLLEACKVAERIRSTLMESMINKQSKEINITVSIGVTERKAGDTAYEEFLERADKALYMAKACGRNCVRYIE